MRTRFSLHYRLHRKFFLARFLMEMFRSFDGGRFYCEKVPVYGLCHIGQVFHLSFYNRIHTNGFLE